LPAAFAKTVPTSTPDLKSIETHVESLIARVTPAVVAVEVGGASGSGVVITADGLVLTAGHVCGGANRAVRFTFPDGKTAYGRTLGVGLDSDTGLMRITNAGPWACAPVGDLGQQSAGDWVLALGHPGGFDLKRSLVVRLGRVIRATPRALQTDCTIAPGDSGGPLFDMNGRVIGIHTAIAVSLADNFHVPITRFEEGWDQLVKDTSGAGPLPTWFGAAIADDPKGCRLTRIDKDSPASKAGLKIGDVILEVEGRTIAASASLLRWLAESDPGDILRLRIKRGAQTLSLKVKLASPRPK
jgi:serine protease Do